MKRWIFGVEGKTISYCVRKVYSLSKKYYIHCSPMIRIEILSIDSIAKNLMASALGVFPYWKRRKNITTWRVWLQEGLRPRGSPYRERKRKSIMWRVQLQRGSCSGFLSYRERRNNYGAWKLRKKKERFLLGR